MYRGESKAEIQEIATCLRNTDTFDGISELLLISDKLQAIFERYTYTTGAKCFTFYTICHNTKIKCDFKILL
jgi:hypothetical protein